MNKMKRFVSGASVLLVLSAAVGCGQAKTTDSGAAAQASASGGSPAQPVTLTVFQNGAEISDDDFKLLFVDPVKKKYPNLTLNLVRPDKGATLDTVIAAGNVPDILLTPNADLLGLSQKDILFDISPLVKKRGLDLNRFKPVTIDAIKSEKGELWGLPYAMQFNALYYNKDIFNKLGVAFPKDGMTWEDAIELAKKLTRKEGDIQYRGLDPVSSYIVSFPLSLTFVNAKTNKANVNNEQWKRVFELTKQILTIPGNAQPSPEPGAASQGKLFVTDKDVAMLASTNLMAQIGSAANGLDWDIAQYPSFKDKPNVSGKLDTHNLAISKTSAHKEEAMNVLETVVSEEVQLQSARQTARMSSLKAEEPQKQFGADVAYLKGKNVQAIFKSTVSPAPLYSPYENNAKKIEQQKFKDYLADKVDVNTALTQADEEINKMLDSLTK